MQLQIWSKKAGWRTKVSQPAISAGGPQTRSGAVQAVLSGAAPPIPAEAVPIVLTHCGRAGIADTGFLARKGSLYDHAFWPAPSVLRLNSVSERLWLSIES